MPNNHGLIMATGPLGAGGLGVNGGAVQSGSSGNGSACLWEWALRKRYVGHQKPEADCDALWLR